MCPCLHTGYLTASKKKEQQLQGELDTIRCMCHDKDQQISRMEQELQTEVTTLKEKFELERKGERILTMMKIINTNIMCIYWVHDCSSLKFA